jgi:hypothetical protein
MMPYPRAGDLQSAVRVGAVVQPEVALDLAVALRRRAIAI